MTTQELRANVSYDAYEARLLGRPLSLSAIRWEFVAYALLIVIGVITHMWSLGYMAMHHDESIHAWTSWKFFTGTGGFACGIEGSAGGGPNDLGGPIKLYCYDPVYHGPTLYLFTYLSYFLFGISEATSRLPMAVAGVALIGSCWMLRPMVGRRAALLTAVYMTFSPTLLYFTRFARHDALILLWSLWLFVGIFRYLQEQRGRWLYLAAAALALAWATHELVFILLFIIGSFLSIRLLGEMVAQKTYRQVLLGTMALLLIPMLMPKGGAISPGTGGIAMLFFVAALMALVVDVFGVRRPAINPAIKEVVLAGGGVIVIMLLMFLIEAPVEIKGEHGDNTNTGGIRYLAALALPLAYVLYRIYETSSATQRRIALTALGVFLTVFTLCFTVFFTHMRGFSSGFVDGLRYWLFSQHEARRGAQPWYYYLTMVPIYEPVALLLSLGGVFWYGWQRIQRPSTPAPEEAAAEPAPIAVKAESSSSTVKAESSGSTVLVGAEAIALHEQEGNHQDQASETVVVDPGVPTTRLDPALVSGEILASEVPNDVVAMLFRRFVFFWFVLALVAFSWAGEKMPWLVVHITLPASIAAGIVLDGMLSKLSWSDLRERRGWEIVPLFLVFLLSVFGLILVSLPAEQQGQDGRRILGALLAGLVLFRVFRLSDQLKRGTILRIAALSMLGLLSLYTIRAMVVGVYHQPDVPRELLVYTQTSPDVPILVEQVKQISENLTRNERTPEDQDGGNGMKIGLSSGYTDGDGSLAWPMEWYLRDYPGRFYLSSEDLQKATPELFQDAPVVMLHKPGVGEATKAALELGGYVQVADTMFNWWVPEQNIGYKDRLYDEAAGCLPESAINADPVKYPGGSGQGGYDCPLNALGSLLRWLTTGESWGTIWRYAIWRQFPEGANINGREMVVYMKCNVAPLPNNGCGRGSGGGGGGGTLKLVAEQVLAAGQINDPRGMAISADGKRIYVAEGFGNRVVMLDAATGVVSGTLEGVALNEPSGVAVDQQGNIYVANTWSGTIEKFDPSGLYLKSWGTPNEDLGPGQRIGRTDGTAADNEAKPLNFFGPRGVAVDQRGNVYIADTGNKRIVVTDSEGNYLYQWGTAGSQPGQFSEPVGVSVGPDQRVYVGDTWNSRVQVFAIGPEGRVDPFMPPIAVLTVRGWTNGTYNNPFIAAGPNGTVAVSVPERHEVQLHDSINNKVLISWGGSGTDDASMEQPSGVLVDEEGMVYVTDRQLGRILTYRPPRVR